MSSNSPPTTRYREKWKETIMSGEETIVCSRGTSLSQGIYEALRYSKKIHVTLCFGLKNPDGTPLIDIDSNPWCHEPKGVVKLANRELAFEVQRRQKLFATCEILDNADRMPLMMKPRNKPREALIEWMNDCPLVDQDCVSYLMSEANRVQNLFQTAIDESREIALVIQHGSWSGSVPYLRLIHCITDYDITPSAYLRTNEVKKRDEIDAANSPLQCKTGYDVIADKWNDPTFNPTTTVSSCHPAFENEIVLFHSKVKRLVPADPIAIHPKPTSNA